MWVVLRSQPQVCHHLPRTGHRGCTQWPATEVPRGQSAGTHWHPRHYGDSHLQADLSAPAWHTQTQPGAAWEQQGFTRLSPAVCPHSGQGEGRGNHGVSEAQAGPGPPGSDLGGPFSPWQPLSGAGRLESVLHLSSALRSHQWFCRSSRLPRGTTLMTSGVVTRAGPESARRTAAPSLDTAAPATPASRWRYS